VHFYVLDGLKDLDNGSRADSRRENLIRSRCRMGLEYPGDSGSMLHREGPQHCVASHQILAAEYGSSDVFD
jgi:hypothetical protein